jgi:catechol 2,3-dioxygenase-like lactoylglutathione lyase family enzyme
MKIVETNVTIMVKDFEASLKFYESIGFTLKKRWDSFYAMLTVGGLTIGIHPGEPGQTYNPGDTLSIGLIIENGEEARALLLKHNIPFEEKDEQAGLFLYFKDPDGVTIYLNVPKWSY